MDVRPGGANRLTPFPALPRPETVSVEASSLTLKGVGTLLA
jgi:hypothetical protein